MARLPAVGSDDGSWGTLLNEYLEVSHDADGTQLPISTPKVATIQELKDLAAPATGNPIVYVCSYTIAGDGGEGFFLWDDSSSSADDAGTIISPTSAPATGRWKRQYFGGDSNMVNPHWFGATGDGTTDDTEAINAAIALGQPVSFLAGRTYRVAGSKVDLSRGLVIPSNTTLIGNGATLKLLDNQTTGQIDWATVIRINRKSNVKIMGFTLDGNKDNQNPDTSDRDGGAFGITFPSCSDCYFADLIIQNNFTDGIYANYLFAFTAVAGLDQTLPTRIVFERCICDGNERNGISIINLENTVFRDCTVTNTTGYAPGPNCAVDIEPNFATDVVKNIEFHNCVWMNSGNEGFNINGPAGGTLKNIRLYNNKFISNSQLSVNTKSDLRISAVHASLVIQDVYIYGTHFDSTTSPYIIIGGGGVTSAGRLENVVIDSCHFLNHYLYASNTTRNNKLTLTIKNCRFGFANAAQQLRIADFDIINVENCFFEHNTGSAIKLVNTISRVTIRGCSFKHYNSSDETTKFTNTWSIRSNDAALVCPEIDVTDCHFVGNGGDAFMFDGTTTNVWRINNVYLSDVRSLFTAISGCTATVYLGPGISTASSTFIETTSIKRLMADAPEVVTIAGNTTITRALHQGRTLNCTAVCNLTFNNSTDFEALASTMIYASGGIVTLVATATINRISGKPLTIPQYGRVVVTRSATADSYIAVGDLA